VQWVSTLCSGFRRCAVGFDNDCMNNRRLHGSHLCAAACGEMPACRQILPAPGLQLPEVLLIDRKVFH